MNDDNNKFEIIKKNGKFFLRWYNTYKGTTEIVKDMMIYGIKSGKSYVKYMSGYLGNILLTDDMKEQLYKA